jgi:hypothetical protein
MNGGMAGVVLRSVPAEQVSQFSPASEPTPVTEIGGNVSEGGLTTEVEGGLP